MPTNTTATTALTCLQQARNDLLRAVLPASEAVAVLDGSRAARARELVSLIEAAISHAERLATVVEGDLRAGAR